VRGSCPHAIAILIVAEQAPGRHGAVVPEFCGWRRQTTEADVVAQPETDRPRPRECFTELHGVSVISGSVIGAAAGKMPVSAAGIIFTPSSAAVLTNV